MKPTMAPGYNKPIVEKVTANLADKYIPGATGLLDTVMGRYHGGNVGPQAKGSKCGG